MSGLIPCCARASLITPAKKPFMIALLIFLYRIPRLLRLPH